jgi:hypothetical protein
MAHIRSFFTLLHHFFTRLCLMCRLGFYFVGFTWPGLVPHDACVCIVEDTIVRDRGRMHEWVLEFKSWSVNIL